MSFGYMIATPIPIADFERLRDKGIEYELRGRGEIILKDPQDNYVWAHVGSDDSGGITYFSRYYPNNSSYIMSAIADEFGQHIFASVPENDGAAPIYSPAKFDKPLPPHPDFKNEPEGDRGNLYPVEPV